MSTIQMPDPHPGRCRNHRLVGDEMLRCLDYENVAHVCSFPEPQVTVTTGSWTNQTYKPEPPRPWVKP